MRKVDSPPKSKPAMGGYTSQKGKLANLPSPPTPPAASTPADTPKTSTPHIGVRKPIKARPKPREFEAVFFEDFESLQTIIPWLGKAFYALTNGDPVTIEGYPIKAQNKKEEDGPLDNMILIILDNITGNLLAVQTGHWIIYNADDGYATLTDEVMNRRYDFI